MIDSITLHIEAVRKAKALMDKHIANPASTCICYKCENARKGN